jgi:hypothetical protein
VAACRSFPSCAPIDRWEINVLTGRGEGMKVSQCMHGLE